MRRRPRRKQLSVAVFLAPSKRAKDASNWKHRSGVEELRVHAKSSLQREGKRPVRANDGDGVGRWCGRFDEVEETFWGGLVVEERRRKAARGDDDLLLRKSGIP